MKSIIDKIGQKKLSTITDDVMRRIFNEFSDVHTQSVIDKRWCTCRRIFVYAWKKGYLQNNVFEELKKPKSRKVNLEEENIAAFTDEELQRISEAAKSHDTLFPILIVLKGTGMRPGELRALLWKNFDAESGTIKIVSAATKKYSNYEDPTKKAEWKEIISVPKSKYSKRTLDLPDEAVDALIHWRKLLDNSKNKKMKESQYIFPSDMGDFMREDGLSSLIKRFVKKHNLQDTKLTPYKFRHTMCTRLIISGIAIPIIQRIMGDNTADVIMKIYTHVYRDDVKAASKKFFEEQNRKYRESKESGQKKIS